MKKVLSILIVSALLVSTAAYAAPGGVRGREKGGRDNKQTNSIGPRKPMFDDRGRDRDDWDDIDDDDIDDDDIDDKDDEDFDKDDDDDMPPPRPGKPEEGVRPETPKSSAKPERPDRPERPESSAKPERPDRPHKNDGFREELDNIKETRREHKAKAEEIINALRDIFAEASKSGRKEILDEIAQIKKELKDCSIGVFMRGKHVDFDKYDGVMPEIVNDRTLIPLRAVSETLGAEVEWNDEEKTVTVTYGDNSIVITVGNMTALVNGEEVEIDSPALIKKDRVLVPIRIIAEALGLKVEWDSESNSVIVDEEKPASTEKPMPSEDPVQTEEPVSPTHGPSVTPAM